MSEAPSSPRRRGRPPRLTRDEIVRAARAVLEREGVAALTMRRLAREVGSAPMGLYHHVADKDELLVLLLEAEAAELGTPALPDDPRERIVAAAMFIHDALDARPWVLEAITPGDRFASSALGLVEEIVAGFVACGLPLDDGARAYRALWYLIAGELTIRHAAGRRATSPRRSKFAQETLASVDPEQLPTLAQVAPRWWDVMDDYAPAEHVAAFVDGLIARYARR